MLSRLSVQHSVAGRIQSETISNRALRIDRDPKLRILRRLVRGGFKIRRNKLRLAESIEFV